MSPFLQFSSHSCQFNSRRVSWTSRKNGAIIAETQYGSSRCRLRSAFEWLCHLFYQLQPFIEFILRAVSAFHLWTTKACTMNNYSFLRCAISMWRLVLILEALLTLVVQEWPLPSGSLLESPQWTFPLWTYVALRLITITSASYGSVSGKL